MSNENPQVFAKYIDHTLLSASAISSDIEKLCGEAIEYGFHSVCINPRWISLAADELNKTPVKIASVVGFPLGAELTEIKAAQTKAAIFAGADEIDMVIDIASVLQGDVRYLENQLETVLQQCRAVRPNVLLKVIIESALLNEEQIKSVCLSASKLGVDFVKTSTGTNKAGGATVEAVKLMKEWATGCEVKAAGGIKTFEQLKSFVNAGASRIGTSSAVDIMNQLEGR
jgi:deoxyribose-phosphate aldolase